MSDTIVELPPDPRARGRAHGEALRDSIRGHLEIWQANLDGGRGTDPQPYLEQFAQETGFLPAIRRWTPELIEEVEGIAEGAAQPLPLIWALQLLDEEWAYSNRRAILARSRDKCSAFGIAGDGVARPTLAGQNMDLGSYTGGFQALLHLAGNGEGPPALVFTLAGLIGLMGVNAAGLAVHVNTLSDLPSAARGLPVAFVMRGALVRPDAHQAAEFIRSTHHASGQHYLLADSRTVISLESSSAGSVLFAGQARGLVLHTNHALGTTSDAVHSVNGNSLARLTSLERRLGRGSAASLEEAKAALSSFDDPQHPICRLKRPGAGTIGYTVGSMVTELSATGPVTTEIAFGPPSENAYRRHNLPRWQPARMSSQAQAGATV